MHASMNRSFKVVYNVALGAYVAVSEITRGKSKSTTTVIAMAVAVLLSGAAQAGPLGGNVVGGQATIQNSGALTTINQATNRAIINWNGFNVNKNETVQFNHPNINAVTLNRVLSASPSLIDGALKANGKVFIVNAAGIVVGKNANINVGGLTLSTLGISNEDFMAGRDKFVNSTGANAQVLNQGNIEVAQGGFVAMIGGQVNNSGVIVAKEGMVALASGNAVTLTIGDGPTAHSIVVEQGTVDALVEAGGAIRVDGGQIVLAARSVNGLLKNIINQTGVLEASSLTRKGGKIVLDGGDQGIVNIAGTIKADGQTGGSVVATGRDVLLTGKISATGKSDGGQVNVGGGFQGQDSSIAHAANVAMTRSASIDVSSTDNSNGGTAVLWSDGTTDFYGDIKAKGGANSGSGGLIETSGHNLGFQGTVDVSAPKGTAGNILLDPDIIIITSAATGAQDASIPTITSTAADAKGTQSTVSVNAIEAITAGTVSLQANGHIQVQDLTLNGGDGEINMKPNVNLNLSSISNTGSFTALPGTPTSSVYGGIGFVNNANGITATGTGSVTLTAGNSTTPGATVVNANAQAINIGHIQTEAGAIKLQGADGLDVKGNLRTTTGAIFLDGDSDQGGVGYLNVTSNFKTDSGLVTLKGGYSAASGVNIIGNVDVGSGALNFGATSGSIFAGTYRIAGNVSALNNFNIAQPVTLAGNATIKTTGQLGFGSTVNVEANSNLTLTATSYSIPSAINGNGASITLKPANVTDDLQLGTGGTGTNVAPVLTKLNNFGNVTIGGTDLQGKVTVSGTNTIVGKLTIAAGGTGGTVVMQDGTNLTTNKDIIVTADKSITAEGTALLTSTGGKVSLVTPGDLTLTAGTKLKATTFVELATDGKFTNPAGLGLIDAATPYWRLYVPNADSLVDTGFSASTGFHRYGCTLVAGCAATTNVPGTGSGILFKDVPLIDIYANSGTLVYGNGLTTFGTIIGYSTLINGDTIADAGVSGNGGNAYYSNSPTYSTGGHVNAGTQFITPTTGTLVSSMGYKFKEYVNSVMVDVTKRTLDGTAGVANKTYDGTTAASLTGLSGLAGDNIAVNSTATFANKNAGANKAVNGTYSIGGADAANYQVDASGAASKAISTTASINQKDVTAAINAVNKTYDGNDTATTTANISGLIANDDAGAITSNSKFSDKNAATGKTVTASVGLTGADATNYNLTTPIASTTANIDKKLLNATLTALTKTYDATTNATITGFNLTNYVAGDNLTASPTNVAFADKNAGVNKAVNGTVTLGGTDANNYAIGSFTGTGTIDRKQLSASLTAGNKVYNGTTAATGLSGSFGSGVIAGDSAGANFVGAAFADKNAGTNKNVIFNFNINGVDGGNYFIGNAANQYITTASITPKSINSNIVAADKTYDGTNAATLTSANLTGVIAADVSTVNLNVGAANFSDKNAAIGKTVTAASSITGSNAGNYTLSNPSTTTTANINKKDITAAFQANTKTYDGNTSATLAGATTLNGVIANDVITSSVSGIAFADKNAGVNKTVNGTVNLSGADAGNYNVATSNGAGTIDRKVLTATAAINDKTYDGNTVAQWNSISLTGGQVTGDGVGLDVASNIVSAFSDKNAGTNKAATVSIGLNGVDAGNYFIGNTSNQIATTGNITPKAISYTGVAANKVYDGNTTATITSGNLNDVIAADASTVNLTVNSANFSDKNAADGKTVTINSSISGANAGNYTLAPTSTTTANITRKEITANLTSSSKVYDGTTNAPVGGSVGTNSYVAGDNISLNYLGSKFSDKNVGINKVVTSSFSLIGIDAANYYIGNSNNQYIFTSNANITPKTLTSNGIIASNKVYDGNTTATATTNLAGVVAGDNLTTSVAANFSDKNAANGKTVSGVTTLGGTDAGNYRLNNVNSTTTANITKKIITNNGITASNKTYDGTTAATVTGAGLTDLVANDDVNISITNANFSDKNAGVGKTVTATTNLTGTDANNYAFNSATSTTTANIDKKAVVASLATVSKTYDATDTANSTATSTDFLINDAVSVVATDAKYSDKNAGVGKSVTATVSLTGIDANNYSVTSAASGTGDITKKAISGDITAANKTYDGTTAATVTGSTTGKVIGDDLGITASNGNFADKNAGTGKVVTAEVGLSGNDANNYSLNSTSASTTADIGKKTLTNAGIAASDKTYDATTTANATANAFTDVIGSDIVTGTVAANFADKNAGNGKTVTGVTTLGGNDANNYELDTLTSTATASITKRDVTNTGITASNKNYDGTTAATATSNTLTDIINGDFVSASVAAQFGDKNAGNGKIVTGVTTLSGNDASNYNLVNNTSTTTADISKKVITNNGITASNKTYDGTTAATVAGAGLTDLVANDDVQISISNANFSDKNAGIGKTVTATTNLIGTDANNYEFNSATSTTIANIDKKTVSVNGTVAANKIYDATTIATATAGTVTGLVGTDTVTASITDAQFIDKNAGNAKTVNITTALGGADIGNYQIDSAASTVTANIDKKVIANNGIVATGKTYDGTTAAFVTANGLTDIIGTDQVQTSVVANFSDKNAGTGKTVTGVTTLTGTDSGNYAFNNDTSTATADIAKKVITNNGITASSKIYDGTAVATATGLGLTNLVAGDDVNISVNNANFSDKNAGVGKTVTATTNLIGADAGNYEFNSATSTTTANIDKRVISAAGSIVDNKTYDGTTAAQVNGTTLVNIVQNDDINVAATGNFDNKNAGVQKDVSIAYALNGTDANNYALDSTSAQGKADVAKKTLTYTVDANGQKTYFLGQTKMPIGFTPTLNNQIAGDDVNVEGLTFVSNGQAVVPAKTGEFTVGITIDGKDATNYEVDYSGSSANTPVTVINNNTPNGVNSQRTAAVSDFVQQISYVPVYANGRGIDSKAKVTSVTPEDDEADTLKGNRAGAVGTRSEPELNLMFKDPARIKDVDDEMKK